MAPDVFGRTNRTFSNPWLRLVVDKERSPFDTVKAALARSTVLDISTNPGLWGGQMRGTENELMATGSQDLSRATGRKHAADLLDAHLIQVLSSIGREWIDFYFLDACGPLEHHQIEGALEAMELARGDGHIRFLGIKGFHNESSMNMVWGSHDAFEVVWLHTGMDAENRDRYLSKAISRRVGVLSEIPVTSLAGISTITLMPFTGAEALAGAKR